MHERLTMDLQHSATEGFSALQAESKALASEAAAFCRIVMALSRPEGYEKLRKLEHDLSLLDSLEMIPSHLLEAAGLSAESARQWLLEEWNHRASAFADELRRYLSDRAITAVVSGHEVGMHPFLLTLEPAKDRAQLTYAGEPMGKVLPLSCQPVLKAYSDALAVLERNQTPPEIFADELIEAYREASGLKGIRPGGRVRLSDVHFALFVRRQTSTVRSDPRKGRIKEYPRYQFAWDIALLLRNPEWLKRSEASIAFHPAAASASKSRADSIRIVSVEGEDTNLGAMQA